jgi:hypothetical protein
LDKVGKKLVLLLDNIDRIFQNLGEETSLLREHLQNYKDIKIVGGSTRMTEYFWSYNQPFYEFFRILQLQPLDSTEVRTVLLNWADKMQIPKLKQFVENRPGQLETIRILTDGLPRTLQFFVNILLTHDEETGYDYLRLLMDKVTPLYQERLNNLPPSQRKIVLQMAFAWEAVGAKELAQAARMENRVISAQFSQLIDKGVVDKIETNTKNHLYRLSERFFNLWLIVTQGGPREKRRARYLSVFLENFYDEKELNELARKHWSMLEKGAISANKAVLLTKAYSQSRYIPFWLRDELINETLKLSDIDMSLKKELPSTIIEIINTALKMVDNGELLKAIRLIESIDQEDGIKESTIGFIYYREREYLKAEEYLLQAFEKGLLISSTVLASLYTALNKFELVEKYSRVAFENKIISAARKLSFAYYRQNKNKEEALSILYQAVQSKQDIDEVAVSILPVLKAWNGDFNGLKEEVFELVRNENDNLDFLLRHLLIHYQVLLVKSLFASEEFGQKLTDQFIVVAYATQFLSDDIRTGPIRMPPEIQSAVNDYLMLVYKQRDYYYGTNEAASFQPL